MLSNSIVSTTIITTKTEIAEACTISPLSLRLKIITPNVSFPGPHNSADTVSS